MTSQTKWREFFKQAGLIRKKTIEYGKIFANSSITFELLPEINKDVLNELHVTNPFDQDKILQQAKQKIEEMQHDVCPPVIEHCEVTLEAQSENYETVKPSMPLNIYLTDSMDILDGDLKDISSEYLYEEEVEDSRIYSREKRQRKKINYGFSNFEEMLSVSDSNKKDRYVRKKRHWSEEDMQQALACVRQDGMSLSASAKRFKIPRQTLHDRLHSKYNSNKYGRPTCLSETEEEILLDFISYKNSQREPLNITEIRMLATAMAKGNDRPNSFKSKGAGHAWWQCFRKRHEDRLKLGLKPNRFQKGKSIRTTVATLKEDLDTYLLTSRHKDYLNDSQSSQSCSNLNFDYRKQQIQYLARNNNKKSILKLNKEPELLKTIQSAKTQVQDWLTDIKGNKDKANAHFENDINNEESSSESESEVSDDDTDSSDVTSSSSSEEETECTDDEKSDVCAICHREKPVGCKKKRILWIFCEQCEYWYHVDCEAATKKDLQKDQYFCKRCQYNK